MTPGERQALAVFLGICVLGLVTIVAGLLGWIGDRGGDDE